MGNIVYVISELANTFGASAPSRTNQRPAFPPFFSPLHPPLFPRRSEVFAPACGVKSKYTIPNLKHAPNVKHLELIGPYRSAVETIEAHWLIER